MHITISRNGIFLDSLSPPIFNCWKYFFESIGHFGGISDRRLFLAVLDGVADGAEVLAAGLD